MDKIVDQIPFAALLRSSFSNVTNSTNVNTTAYPGSASVRIPQRNAFDSLVDAAKMKRYLWLAIAASPLFLILSLAAKKAVQRARERSKARAFCVAEPTNLVKLKDPILGIDYMLETLKAGVAGVYITFMCERFRKLGNTFVTRRFLYDSIQTIEPENLKSLLATGFDSWKIGDLRAGAFKPLFGNGIFSSNGAKWKHERGLIRPSFSKTNMQPLLQMLERHFTDLMRCIPQDGSTFDLQSLMVKFTMDSACEFLFGHTGNALADEWKASVSGADVESSQSDQEDANFIRDYVGLALDTTRRLQLGWLQLISPFSLNRRRVATRDRVWAYIDKFVKEALELRKASKSESEDGGIDGSEKKIVRVGAPEYNFLHEVANETEDPIKLREQILNILLASSDTTSALLSNFFWEVSHHPDVYAKLREEVAQHLHGELPIDSQLKNMVYLRWCVNETLRLHPSIPANSREAAVDTTLPVGGGPDGKQPFFVPKGTSIMFYVFAMHRRKDLYGEDAEEFRPDRWDGLRPGWGYLPFNGGPRICIGQQFALSEASYVIVRMIQTFEKIEARDDRPWHEFYHLALFSKHGVQVGVTPQVSAE